MLGYRDREFVNNRLSAPAVDVLEAHERIRSEYPVIAAELMAHVQTFTDACREVRQAVEDERQRESRLYARDARP